MDPPPGKVIENRGRDALLAAHLVVLVASRKETVKTSATSAALLLAVCRTTSAVPRGK